MITLSKEAQRMILKVMKNNMISSKEYNNIVKKHNSSSHKKTDVFSFRCNIEKNSDLEYTITLFGKHLSTNRVNSLSFKNRLRYKTSIKKAIVEDGYLLYKNILPKQAFKKAEIWYEIYLPKSRDDDNNYSTLKIIRDCIISLGIVVDDKRENLVQTNLIEYIQKEYKIVVHIKSLDNL